MVKALSLLTFSGATALFQTPNTTPVQKVVEMLNEMSEKGKAAMHEEQVQYAAYKQFCDDTTTDKARQIAESARVIEEKTSVITVKTARIEELSKEIADNEAQIAANQADLKSATAIREKENTEFLAMNRDYSESVDAIERAVAVLEKQNYDRKQASAELLQLNKLPIVPAWAKAKIQSFIATGYTDDADELPTPPEANAYEFQSGGVIDMLEKLRDKFVDERTNLQKEESNDRHAYDMLKLDIQNDNEDRENQNTDMKGQRAEAQQAKGEAEGAKADAERTKAADEKYKLELDSTCSRKAADFEERQKLRGEELEAIAKAVEILSSADVAGNAAKHMGFFQKKAMSKAKAVSFLQVRSYVKSPYTAKAAEYLKERAQALNSRELSTLAMRMEESGMREDPFKKVTAMIKDLIFRLQKQAAEEADQKGWCDKNLKENEMDRKQFRKEVEKASTDVDLLQANIAQLGTEISDLSEAVSKLTQELAEATELRASQKKENEDTIRDAKDGQTAVSQALVILKEFYAKAGQATAFVQSKKQQPVAPEIFEEAYTGMGAESGGIVGMLEVIQSDFARLESETTAAENEQEDEFNEFKSNTRTDIEVKNTDIQHKTLDKQRKEAALANSKDDLKASQKQLSSAMETYEKLKPACVNSGVNYEERVQRREEEIQSLKEALRILSGEEFTG